MNTASARPDLVPYVSSPSWEDGLLGFLGLYFGVSGQGHHMYWGSMSCAPDMVQLGFR